MQVQRVMPTVKRALKTGSPLTIINRGNKAIRTLSAKHPNGSVMAYAKSDGSYGVGVLFDDLGGCGAMTGKAKVKGKLVDFHAQLEPGTTPGAAAIEIQEILAEYNAGRCVDITEKVLAGERY